MWWDEIWRWVWCPGVDTLWTGIDLSIRLVAVVEWWGVLAHGSRAGEGAVFSSSYLLLYPIESPRDK